MNEAAANPAEQFAIEVVRKLRSSGYEALLAGGCVRDMLMGRPPKDYDVATNARPQQIREVFGRKKTIPIGAAFGVIAVVGPKAAGVVEVATFRQDAQYSDGRHPDSVTFTTAEEDAQRRDFTINGIFYDPIGKSCIDFVDGQSDIKRRSVRAIGNPYDRLNEDKLRMLRAVRFAATLRFEIDARTTEAIQQGAEMIEQVSAERISQELRRMLTHENRATALRLLNASRLLRTLLPEVVLANYPQEDEQGSWGDLLQIMARLGSPTFAVAFAVLLREAVRTSDLKEEMVEVVGRRLRLTNEEIEGALFVLRHESIVLSARSIPWPTLQRVLIAARIDELLTYAEGVAEVQGGVEDVAFCRERLRLPAEQLNPAPLINGGLLKRLGLPPGPLFKEILETIRDEQLDGHLTSTAEAVERIRANWIVDE